MERYDKGLLGNMGFKARLSIPDREILVQNWKNRGKSGFLNRGKNLKPFEILSFLRILLIIKCNSNSKILVI